ncbi:MAG: glycosyltransferase [Patescibacteria group bacterium]|jgi:glycosyltransferase involved in cell wall biosynthesis
MTNQNKKILLVSSYAPPLLAGAPRFMANLLETFPPESYTILTSFYNIDNISAKIGTWLPGKYIFYDNLTATPTTRQHQEVAPSEVAINPMVKLKKFLRKTFLFPAWVKAPLSAAVKMDLVAKLKRFLKRNSLVKALIAAPLILGQIPLIIRHGRRAIKDDQSDLMIGFSDYGPAMVGTYYIHRATGIPFYIYLFDIYKGNLLPLTGKILATIFEPRLIKAAQKIMVTNQETKEFYRRRYGQKVADKIVVIHNSTNPDPYLKLQTPIIPHQPPYYILFTGNVYWAQTRSLKNLITALDQLTDIDVRLKIYSPSPPEYLKALGIASPKIEYNVAPGSEMPKIQSQADILFIPLSWQTQSPDIINTATPGKLTDFLIAGRPILIHAPETSHLVKYAKENDFAAVVDEENITALQNAIRQLIGDTALAQRLVTNAQRVFFTNHDIKKNSQLFQHYVLGN